MQAEGTHFRAPFIIPKQKTLWEAPRSSFTIAHVLLLLQEAHNDSPLSQFSINALFPPCIYTPESFGLIGMQLPEKNKENFDVSNDDPRNFPTKPKGLRSKCRNFPCIFQVVESLSIRNFLIIGTTYTDTATQSKIYTGRHLMDHSPISSQLERASQN